MFGEQTFVQLRTGLSRTLIIVRSARWTNLYLRVVSGEGLAETKIPGGGGGGGGGGVCVCVCVCGGDYT